MALIVRVWPLTGLVLRVLSFTSPSAILFLDAEATAAIDTCSTASGCNGTTPFAESSCELGTVLEMVSWESATASTPVLLYSVAFALPAAPGDTRPSEAGIGGVAGTVSSRADEAEDAGVSTAAAGDILAGGTRMEIPPWLSDVMRGRSGNAEEQRESKGAKGLGCWQYMRAFLFGRSGSMMVDVRSRSGGWLSGVEHTRGKCRNFGE